MLTNVRYILLTALRDWLFVALLVGVLGCAMIAHFLGSTALVEMQEMTLSYTAASSRVVIVLGLIVFTCFHVRNSFETKEIDVFLSRPITRASLVFSYWLGFAAVSLILVVPTIGMIALQGALNQKGFAIWSLSLLLECFLVVAIALFASFTLRSAVTSVMISLGFYTLARMMGFFIATSQTASVFQTVWLNTIFIDVLKFVSVIMPRIDFSSKSEWLIYGVRQIDDVALFIEQGLIYIPLLVLAAITDFRRKQF